MNVNLVPFGVSVLASPSILRPQCSGSTKTSGGLSGLPNSVHVHPTSWLSPAQAFFLVSLAVFPAAVSAAPPTFRPGIDGLQRRGESDSQSSGSISMTVWVRCIWFLWCGVRAESTLCSCFLRSSFPSFLATTASYPYRHRGVRFVFVLHLHPSVCGKQCSRVNDCEPSRLHPRQRQYSQHNAAPSATPEDAESDIDQVVAAVHEGTGGPRVGALSVRVVDSCGHVHHQRGHDIHRGPAETEDDQVPPNAMPMLAEEDEEHHEIRNGTFDIALDRIESVDTMADSSTTNLIRGVSVPRPPELHHATMPHGHRRGGDAHSLDSIGSEAELLAGHQRAISVDNHLDPRGEAPSYTEAVDGRMMTVSLNDPDPNNTSSNPIVPPPSHAADAAAGRARSRFSFLIHNPFSSHNNTSNTSSNPSPPSSSVRAESPALHTASTLSRFSSRESHESHHSRAPLRNNNLSRTHTRSNSNLFRAFRSHSPGLHAGSSTISLDSISAPLTHTVTRAEFHAPKGGLMTPEQIKLITSRQALEKFGVPYGADAVAAFSLSRERLAEMGPPPEFESVMGEHEEQASASGSGGGATEAVVETTDTALPRSTSLLPSPQPSLSHGPNVRAESRASTDRSYATAHESDGEGHPSEVQTVEVYASDDENGIGGADELRTARPMTPRTAH